MSKSVGFLAPTMHYELFFFFLHLLQIKFCLIHREKSATILRQSIKCASGHWEKKAKRSLTHIVRRDPFRPQY